MTTAAGGARMHAGALALAGRAVALVVGASVVTACASLTGGTSATGGTSPAPGIRASTATPTTPPTRTGRSPSTTATKLPPGAVPSPCRYAIGQSLDLRDTANGAGLRIRPTHVTTSRSRLSSDHGYAPRYGYYVQVDVTITDTGSTLIDVSPDDFYLHTASRAKTTVDTGNSPYSGADTALDTTELTPGLSTSGPLTFDVASPHGELVYAPAGSSDPVCSWAV